MSRTSTYLFWRVEHRMCFPIVQSIYFENRTLNPDMTTWPLPLLNPQCCQHKQAGHPKNVWKSKSGWGQWIQVGICVLSAPIVTLTVPFATTRTASYRHYSICKILLVRMGNDTEAFLDKIMVYTKKDVGWERCGSWTGCSKNHQSAEQTHPLVETG